MNLPWGSKIEELTTEGSEDSYWDLITPKPKEPGYLVECVVGGLKIDDVCETASEATTVLVLMLNLPEEEEKLLLVSVFFLKNPLNVNEAAKCSVGGEENGLAIGEVLLIGMRGAANVSLEING